MAPMTIMSLFSALPKELEDRWTDIFRRDTLVHLTVMGAIAASTFQGYLKRGGGENKSPGAVRSRYAGCPLHPPGGTAHR